MSFFENFTPPEQLKNRIRRTHTVNNRMGCEEFNGKWDKNNNVCVIGEHWDRGWLQGWTAPIRGAFFYWSVSTDDDFPMTIVGQRIKRDEGYPDQPTALAKYTGIYDEELDLSFLDDDDTIFEAYKKVKDRALKIAREVIEGKDISKYRMQYFGKKGLNCTAQAPEDFLEYQPGGCGCMSYSPSVDFGKPLGFKVRRH
jgi:hypothetical protein